jgi:hypothetical protein
MSRWRARTRVTSGSPPCSSGSGAAPGWVKAVWGASENNRRARFYTITTAGKKRLADEREEFERLVVASQRVLNMA